MTSTQLIKKAKAIILSHCDPERIWVYGSRLRDDWKQGSDIDIAYLCHDLSGEKSQEIQQSVNEIESLIKLEVKNVSNSDRRFLERVKATGKVIYSSSLKLKVEDALYNFKNALDRLNQTIQFKDKYLNDGYGDVYIDIIVKRFEFSWEMCWKSLKKYFAYEGDPCNSPRSCIQKAYEYEFIQDQDVWLEILNVRNTTSHVYDSWQVQEIADRIPYYYDSLKKIFEHLSSSIDKR